MACGQVLETALPADNSGLAGDIFKIEQSPKSTAPLRELLS